MLRNSDITAGVRKVLIVTDDTVGGTILATPAIRNVREGLSSAHIALLTGRCASPVLSGWECLDEIISYDRPAHQASRRRLVRRLRDERYDLCLVLTSSPEAHKLARQSSASINAGLVRPRRLRPRALSSSWLTHSIRTDADRGVVRGERLSHEVETMLSLLKDIGLPAKDYPLQVPLSHSDSKWAARLASVNCSGHVLIGIHLSDGWFAGGWSALGVALLFDEILRAIPDTSIIATYEICDRSSADQVSSYMEPDNCLGLCDCLRGRVLLMGNISFAQWAGLTSVCSVVLTRNTGSLHLAAALGRPVVAIYDRRSFVHDSQRFAPWKVPHFAMESGYHNETSSEILRRLISLLRESQGKAA